MSASIDTSCTASLGLLAAALVCLVTGCAHYQPQQMIVTAYSSDKSSTNWKRGKVLFWRKYVAHGPNKGERKKVGITSSGSKARKGTIAADNPLLPLRYKDDRPGLR